MKIKYIVLKNYKRFPLRSKNIFEKEFKNKLIAILGPNGSGKSSLIKELTPISTEKNRFFDNGYKEIHIEDKFKNKYVIKADFSKINPYSFIMNDEELNPTGKITYQNFLVKKYFNLDDKIFSVLVGENNFTDMSIQVRKKIFYDITHIDIDSLKDYYEYLKESLKIEEIKYKSISALKSKEEESLINYNEDQIKLNVDKEKNILNALIDIRSNLKSFISDQYVDTDAYEEQMINTYEKLKDYIKSNYEDITSNSYSIIKDKFVYLSTKSSLIKEELKKKYKVLEELEIKIKQNELKKHMSIESLNHDLNKLKNSKINLLKQLNILKNIDENKIDHILNSYHAFSDSLRNMVNDLKASNIITIDYIKQLEEDIIKIKSNLENTEKIRNNLIRILNKDFDTKIYDIIDLNNIKCPKCNLNFSIINDEFKIHVENEKKRLDVEISSLFEYLKNRSKELDDARRDYEIISYMLNIRKATYDYLKDFWNEIFNLDLFNKNHILNVLNLMSNDAYILSKIKEINLEIEKIENQIDTFKSLKDDSIESIKNDYDATLKDIDDLKEELDHISAEIGVISNRITKIESYKKLKENLDEIFKEYVSSLKNLFLNDVINKIELEISKSKAKMIEEESKYKNIINIKSNIEKYNNNLNLISKEIEAIKNILNYISPKDGLIARYITYFINFITDSINSILKSIWEYKMIIKPIDIDKEQLNFRFKVEVDDRITIPDISSVSSGMKEIINLSFRVILYKLMNLDYYPVYLDEFGLRLDSIHRNRAYDLIFKFMKSDSVSQIFLVTHVDSFLFNLNDTEIIDLSIF